MAVAHLNPQQQQKRTVDRWDFDAPLWNLCTFTGRLKYYSWISDPRLSFVSQEKFERAKRLRALYLLGREPEKITERQRLFAKRLYENGYHPDNEEYMNAFGRMSFFGLGAALTGLPLFIIKNPYRATAAFCACMGVHQCYNQFVNTTNRNATAPLTNGQKAIQLATAAGAATGAALLTRGFLIKEGSHKVQKYIPFASLAAAMMVGIPIMRSNELFSGISVYDEEGLEVAKSKIAAVKGISEVVISRLFLIAPAMIFLPFVINRMKTICWVRKNNWSLWPLSALALGGLLLPMVPVSCAIFPQRGSVSTSLMQRFERKEFNKIDDFCRGNIPEEVYFNKGL